MSRLLTDGVVLSDWRGQLPTKQHYDEITGLHQAERSRYRIPLIWWSSMIKNTLLCFNPAWMKCWESSVMMDYYRCQHQHFLPAGRFAGRQSPRTSLRARGSTAKLELRRSRCLHRCCFSHEDKVLTVLGEKVGVSQHQRRGADVRSQMWLSNDVNF